MGRQLRNIARRRAELVVSAKYERLELAKNRAWSSSPLFIIGPLLNLGMAIGSSYYMNNSRGPIRSAWPSTTLKWAGRGLRLWTSIDRIRKGLLRY